MAQRPGAESFIQFDWHLFISCSRQTVFLQQPERMKVREVSYERMNAGA